MWNMTSETAAFISTKWVLFAILICLLVFGSEHNTTQYSNWFVEVNCYTVLKVHQNTKYATTNVFWQQNCVEEPAKAVHKRQPRKSAPRWTANENWINTCNKLYSQEINNYLK